MDLKLEGNIYLPNNLNEILAFIVPLDKDKRTDNSAPISQYIASFKNKIEPVLLCTFYGLYKSRQLPPLVNFPVDCFTEKRDFNVNIGEAAELLSNLLFCLWVKKNGYPDTCEDPVKYRQDLYDFIAKLLDEHYYRNTIIPFYIFEANKDNGGTSSFVHRLSSSGNVKIELIDHSPEHLALEFADEQKRFMNEVVKSTVKHQQHQSTNLSLKSILSMIENDTLEFKGSLRYNINNKAPAKGCVLPSDPKLEKTILATICAFLNSEGGTLVIGVENETNKVLGLKNDYMTFSEENKRNKDGFELHLRNIISKKIVPDIPGHIKVRFESYEDEEVCIVQIRKASEPTYLKEKVGDRDIDEFWVRDGNRKRQLDGVATAKYIKCNWKQI